MTLHILLAIFDYYISLNIHHVKEKFIINIERETIKENYRLYIILFFLIDKNPMGFSLCFTKNNLSQSTKNLT